MKLATALTIAGTDPTGGAGIMADLKSFTARGVYGMAVVTSVVAQNTMGVRAIENISLDMLEAQLKAVYDDISPMAVKTGMLATADMMRVIKPFLSKATPYVMDPVMVATSGDALIDEEARHHLISELMPLATLVTPNLPEAEFLVGRKLTTEADIDKAARDVLDEQDYAKTLINRVGHGIGYMIHEAPDIKECNPRRLERGMSFSIEPGVYLANVYGMRIENIVAINHKGETEILNKVTRELTIIK